MNCVVILTGERGVGKSTVCRETASLAQERGYTCGGILTLAHHGVRDVLDVYTGCRRRLTVASGGDDAVTQGRFHFDPQALNWGNTVMARATPCDLLIIDEVGPLEMERGRGWVTAFDVLLSGGYRLGLLIVRPELITQAQDRLAGCLVQVLAVTLENRDCLPISLVERMEQET